MIDLNLCRNYADSLRKLSKITEDDGMINSTLILSANVIEVLCLEIENLQKAEIDDDSYRPLWPSWDK